MMMSCPFSAFLQISLRSTDRMALTILFVYPVLGTKVSLGPFQAPEEQRHRASRSICYKVAQTMGFLHYQGICHGGISGLYKSLWYADWKLKDRVHVTAKNVIQHTSSLDGLSEEEVVHMLDQPSRNPVEKIDESKTTLRPAISRIPAGLD